MKPFYIFFFALLISTSALGQSEGRKGERTSDTTMSLITKMSDTISIILIDKNGYIVKTSFNDFKENVENWLSKHPHLHSDRKLLKLIIEQAEKQNIIDATKIAESNNLKSRLEFRTADLLEKGQCLISTKSQKTEVASEIKIQYYSYYCGTLCGDGGRRFYIKGILILKVMDWIS